METAITTNPITAAIVTPAGTHHLISKTTEAIIEMANDGDMVELDDGTKVKLTMATIILPLSKYYEEFPDRRPDPRNNYPKPPGTVWDRSNKNGRELMLKGFKKFLDKNPQATRAAKFYKELTSGISYKKSFEPKYNHQYDENGQIIKTAYQVAKEAGVI